MTTTDRPAVDRNKTSIVLADDHKVVRQALRALLEANPGFTVIGEASDGLEASRITESLQPDVLVVDLVMGGINGIEVTQQVTQRSPRTGVVVLSMHSNEAYVRAALRAGAKAYVLKEDTSNELISAIRKVAAGHRYLSSSLSEAAIEAYSKNSSPEMEPYATLTTREREVFHLTARGHSNTEIGQMLFISRRTAELHRANMMRKLNFHSQAEIVRYAIKLGILPSDDEADGGKPLTITS